MLFVSILVLCILIIYSQTKALLTKLIILNTGLAILIFARPEYYVALVIMILLSSARILYCLFRKINIYIEYKPLFFSLSIIAILLLKIGNPIQKDRSYAAFAQHYARNYNELNHEMKKSTEYTDEIVNLSFPNATSIFDAWRINRPQLVQHFRYNLKNYILASIYVGLERPGLYPGSSYVYKTTRYFELILLSVVLLCIAINYKKVKSILNSNLLLYFYISAIMIMIAISSIVIYPREHYLVVQTMLFIFIFSMIISKIFLNHDKVKIHVAFLSGIAIWIITPSLSTGWTANPIKKNETYLPQINIEMIHYFNDIKSKEPIGILWQTPVNEAFVDPNNKIYPPRLKKQIPFRTFIKNRDIKYIVNESNLTTDYYLQNDSDFINFIKDPEMFNFTKMTLPGIVFYKSR